MRDLLAQLSPRRGGARLQGPSGGAAGALAGGQKAAKPAGQAGYMQQNTTGGSMDADVSPGGLMYGRGAMAQPGEPLSLADALQVG